ncbi:MAG TPA: class I SAM-dependent methyltransferase [Firmicutes bacterium]|nr:class I SAM-dependent methyltransferase [Bacillota bacterium]
MFEWDLKKAEWYDRALENSQYTAVFLPIITQLVRGAETALDVCAGVGAFTLPLARLVPSVTAIDCSDVAIQYLQIRAKRHGLSNITCLKVAWEDFKGGPFDVILAAYPADCVVGSVEALSRLHRMALKAVALILPVTRKQTDPPSRRVVAEDVRGYLGDLGIEPSTAVFEYDFGQPFLSRSEAREFVEAYAGKSSSSGPALEEWLNRSLVQRAQGFYLPIKRKSAMVWWKARPT